MKTRLIILALILLSAGAYSQSKNNISVLYGTASNDVDIHGAIGDFGFQQKRGTVYGLNYTREINKIFSIETGLTFSDDKVEENSIVGGMGEVYHDGEIKMVSVPAIVKLSFLKYLYADMGFTIDFQTDYTTNSPAPNQSGIGFEAGIGAKYNFGPAMLFINPYLQHHAIIQFDKGQDFNLTNSGFKFGIGYSF